MLFCVIRIILYLILSVPSHGHLFSDAKHRVVQHGSSSFVIRRKKKELRNKIQAFLVKKKKPLTDIGSFGTLRQNGTKTVKM